MKRALAVAIVAVAVLAGCGTDTCSSNPAKVNFTTASCSLAAGQTATVQLSLCSRCNDSSPSCQAEYISDSSGQRFEVQPTVQQCQDQSGCAASGCNSTVPTVTCSLAIPAGLSGNFPLVVAGENIVQGSMQVGSGGSSCSL
jgi:hypothetical protein